MHPVLFSILKFPIHSYGFMLALSFLIAIWWSSKRARKVNLDPNVITDVGFYVILSAVVGARLYYVFLHFEEFKGNLGSIFNPFQDGALGIGGLVMYGGFIGAIMASVLFFKLKKLPFLPYADAIAPSVGVGIALTRVGCFLNGCCYGAVTGSSLGVLFPPNSPAGAFQLRLHAHGAHAAVPHIYPSQLFETAGGFLITLIILWVGRKKLFTGFQFYLLWALYAILRFGVDLTRYYSAAERIGPLSHNQIVCIVLFVISGGMILKNLLFKEDPAQHKAQTPEKVAAGT